MIQIPHPRPAIIVMIVVGVVFFGFIFFVSRMAIENLLNCAVGKISIKFVLPSIFWFAMGALVIYAMVVVDGVKATFINITGAFANRHFAEIVREENGAPSIRFGFHCLGRSLFYTSIPVAAITEVHWSSGQMTDRAGRDMDDWCVAIWFDPTEAATPRQNDPLFIVGPSRRKDLAATLGRELISFIEREGVTFVQGKDDCTFVRGTELLVPSVT